MHEKLDQLTAMVDGARSMPMSASIVLNKAELNALIAELRETLPSEIAQAQQTVQQGDQVVEEARREAERVIAAAHQERAALVSATEVAMRSQAEANRILDEARRDAGEQRAEADDYVDSKLANFEVVLTKTLGAIGRGRQKLRLSGAPVEGEDGEEFTQDAFRSPSPEVDEYVDVKLAALEGALSKTLEAVGRGRDKLLGKKPIDELAAYLAAADQAGGVAQGDLRQAAVAAELAEQGLLPQQPGPGGYFDRGHDGVHTPEPAMAAHDPSAAPEFWQQPEPVGYGQDQYPQQSGYDQGYPPQPYGQDQYAQQQPYPADPGYDQGYAAAGYDPYAAGVYQQQAPVAYDEYGQPLPQQAPQIPQQQTGSTEVTSFFDTGFLDISKLQEFGNGTN